MTGTLTGCQTQRPLNLTRQEFSRLEKNVSTNSRITNLFAITILVNHCNVLMPVHSNTTKRINYTCPQEINIGNVHIHVNSILYLNSQTADHRNTCKLRSRRLTYFIVEVTFVISMRVEYIFVEARSYLINVLISDSMQQEIRISVFLSIPHLCIKASSGRLL